MLLWWHFFGSLRSISQTFYTKQCTDPKVQKDTCHTRLDYLLALLGYACKTLVKLTPGVFESLACCFPEDQFESFLKSTHLSVCVRKKIQYKWGLCAWNTKILYSDVSINESKSTKLQKQNFKHFFNFYSLFCGNFL